MRKSVLLLICFLVVYSFYRIVLLSFDRPATWSDALTELQEAEFDQTIQTAPPWMVVHVWAPWCTICKQAKPDYNAVAERFPEEIGFFHLNQDENPEWAQTYRVQNGIPSTLIFYRGQEIARHTGRLPAKALENWIAHTTNISALPAP